MLVEDWGGVWFGGVGMGWGGMGRWGGERGMRVRIGVWKLWYVKGG